MAADAPTKRSRPTRTLDRRQFIGAGTTALVATLAGCSGDSSSTPTPTDPPTASPSPTESPTPTPVGPPPITHYKFDESEGASTATDAAGDHDATIEDGVTPGASGQVGTAYSFDGSGAVVDDDAGEYLNGLDAVTVAMWVKAEEVPNDRGIFRTHARDNETEEFDPFDLRYDSEGYRGGGTEVLKGSVRTDGNSENSFETESGLQSSDWQHLALTWRAGEAPALYVDGSEVGFSSAPSAEADDATLGHTQVLIIGGVVKDTRWQGTIDDVRIYDQRLSADVISALVSA